MEKFSIDNASQFVRHFKEDEFWKKVRQVAAQVGAKLIYPSLQLYYLMQSKNVPIKAKALIVGALGYLILPADLVPDFIPALGFTDDLTAIMLTLRTVGKYLTPEIKQQAKEQANKMLNVSNG